MIELDPNARFEKAMFNLLRSFNFIDHNLGLCISFLAGPQSPQNTYNKLSNISFDQRMKWFEKLLTESERDFSEQAKEEFTAWLVQADKARKMRNVYVHAIWRFNPVMVGKPVCISSPVWMQEKLGDEVNQKLSLEELESKANVVERVFEDFMKIRKKYHV